MNVKLGLVACLAVWVICGCGGPGWLGLGLGIEAILDPDQVTEDGEDGTHCWDLDGDSSCGEEEDWTGPEGEPDGVCDAMDCRGADGANGEDGSDGNVGEPGLDGSPGPAGPPGVSPPPQVIVIEVPVEDDPPRGNAWGSDGPNGNPQRP
jgi:hypothetical protein